MVASSGFVGNSRTRRCMISSGDIEAGKTLSYSLQKCFRTDISTQILSFELDFVRCSIRSIECLLEGISCCRHSEYPAAICHQGRALMDSAGVEDDNIGVLFGLDDAGDWQTFFVRTRIAFGREDNISRK